MGWHTLAKEIIHRRVELGYVTREAFVEGSGISQRILGDLETARRASYAPSTLVRLSRALQWPPGRAAEIAEDDDEPGAEMAHPQQYRLAAHPLVLELAELLGDGSGVPASLRKQTVVAVDFAMERARLAARDAAASTSGDDESPH